jgi:antibiotic biosynthesis monooxygenase (ABM) superfamily enzyme
MLTTSPRPSIFYFNPAVLPIMNTPINVAITRRVKPGREREFEETLRAFAHDSLGEPGMRGVYLLHPSAESGSNEYGILRSFASAADREAFYQSPLYRQWLTTIEPLVEGEVNYRELHGLEAWFRHPEMPNPPEWKMALLTWIAVWPVSMAVPAALDPLIGQRVPNVIFAGAVAAGIVLVLTWVAMPLLVKFVRGWLQPKKPLTPVHL